MKYTRPLSAWLLTCAATCLLTIATGAAAAGPDAPATQDIDLNLIVNPGLNDAWYDINTAGQGFFFNVFPDIPLFFLAWFTFDTVQPDSSVTAILGAPDQRWVTASGSWQGNTVTLNAELTTGGVFNSSEPMPTQVQGYGTITIVFHDCNNATLTYNFPSLGLSGQIELTRVVADNVALCESLAMGS